LDNIKVNHRETEMNGTRSISWPVTDSVLAVFNIHVLSLVLVCQIRLHFQSTNTSN